MSQHHTSHSHGSRDHSPDAATLLSREFWEARYRSADQIWSGDPNRRLVEHVADLPPAAVLDPDDWQIVAGAPERQAADPTGRPVTIRDAVLRAQRFG